jgi:ribonuclease R
VVHRALIRALKLGNDGLTDEDVVRLADTAEHITATERRSMAASATPPTATSPPSWKTASAPSSRADHRRDALSACSCAWRTPAPTVSSRSPASGDEYFVHDDRAHALIGDRTGARWRLGREVTVRLTEATPVTGGLLFEMLSEAEPADPSAPRPRLASGGDRARTPAQPEAAPNTVARQARAVTGAGPAESRPAARDPNAPRP